ncbi:MAG: AraC family transcriptional regulator [Longimicrobiales bacterium]
MPLVALLSGAPAVHGALRDPVHDTLTVAAARSFEGLLRMVRERPSTVVVVDSGALPRHLSEDESVGELTRLFPSVGVVFIARPHVDPASLFRLGRAGNPRLFLLPLDVLSPPELSAAIWGALNASVASLVTRAVSPFIPAKEARIVRLALEGVQRGWDTEDLAHALGLTRPHASVRLKFCGLPSAGHLLTWAKLLHAGRWLTDPGRSAQSVSRQLEYSSGAAFRRALRSYVEMTPSEVKGGGGLGTVLLRFLDACGLPLSLQRDRSVA